VAQECKVQQWIEFLFSLPPFYLVIVVLVLFGVAFSLLRRIIKASIAILILLVIIALFFLLSPP